MLRSFNLCRSTLKTNNLIFCNNKYASYCLHKTQTQKRQNCINLSTIRYIPSKIDHPSSILSIVRYSSTNSEEKPNNTIELTKTERLKKAVKEYGATVIVFHVIISLISLGICYVIVSAGLDVEAFFIWLGFTEDITKNLATKTGTFVAAYAFHKMFIPVRISITLASAPFIVRYLRNIGWLKKPVKKAVQNIKLRKEK